MDEWPGQCVGCNMERHVVKSMSSIPPTVFETMSRLTFSILLLILDIFSVRHFSLSTLKWLKSTAKDLAPSQKQHETICLENRRLTHYSAHKRIVKGFFSLPLDGEGASLQIGGSFGIHSLPEQVCIAGPSSWYPGSQWYRTVVLDR